MPLNLLKKYNSLLDIMGMNEKQKINSLKGVFNRDINQNPNFSFRGKKIYPTPNTHGHIKMDELFFHLRTVTVDKITKRREFEISRSERLHWIKYHVEETKKIDMLVFSVDEPEGKRTYIYDESEKYVIVLEPLRDGNSYYLLSAHKLLGKDAMRDKMKKKYKRKLDQIL